MPPVQRSNNKLLWGIVIGVVSLCCLGVIGLVVFGYGLVRKAIPLVVCGVRFERVRDAVVAYANEHNGKLPDAKTWEDDIQAELAQSSSKLKEEQRDLGGFKAGEQVGCVFENSTTGIAFNSELSGKKLDDIKDKSIVLLYEVPAAKHNAAGPYKLSTEPGPKFMNVNREWFTAPVEGDVYMRMNGKSININKNSQSD